MICEDLRGETFTSKGDLGISLPAQVIITLYLPSLSGVYLYSMVVGSIFRAVVGVMMPPGPMILTPATPSPAPSVNTLKSTSS